MRDPNDKCADVTQSTGLTVLVSWTSHRWITDEVKPAATFDLQLVRRPGQQIDFRDVVRRVTP